MPVPELLGLTLCELTERLRARRVSPVELMEVVLRRIEEANPRLNAVVAVREKETLLAEAALSAERLARGEGSPLEGVPFGVKDLEDVGGMVTSQGSVAFRNNVARRDSIQVERLRAAGAIPVGKTNTPEFGYTAITKNVLFGVTRSPWNLERSPGGSSGGSAAALTGGLLPLVTASDGGGSVRIPASFTGAFGLKPSYGRVARGPLRQWEFGDTSVWGPLTRTVADAALFLDQVAGPSPHDPNSLAHPGYRYTEKLAEAMPRGLRIGFSPDLGFVRVQEEVAAAVEEGARVFAAMGHTLQTFEGGPPRLGADWTLQSQFFRAAQLHSYLPEHEHEFGRAFLAGIRSGWTMTPERWASIAESRARLNDWCAEAFSRFDLLITPTVPFDPPPAAGPWPADLEGGSGGILAGAFTIPFNMSWHPASTVRVGISRAGLPIGMQIVGPRTREDLVLQASLAFERERPWHPHWPVES